MKRFEFIVPGKPVGYTTHNRSKGRGHRASAAVLKFWGYAEAVRLHATRQTGVTFPLESSRDNPWFIFTLAIFASRVHADPENIHKGIKDALFYKAVCGDKYTGGAYLPPLYHADNPCAYVICVPQKELIHV